KIGTGVRLRVTLAPDILAIEDSRQIACLLCFASTRDQRWAELCLAQIDDAGNARALQFLVIDDLFGERQAHPTVLLRPGRSAPAMPVQRSKPAARFFAAQTAKWTSNVLAQMFGV